MRYLRLPLPLPLTICQVTDSDSSQSSLELTMCIGTRIALGATKSVHDLTAKLYLETKCNYSKIEMIPSDFPLPSMPNPPLW